MLARRKTEYLGKVAFVSIATALSRHSKSSSSSIYLKPKPKVYFFLHKIYNLQFYIGLPSELSPVVVMRPAVLVRPASCSSLFTWDQSILQAVQKVYAKEI